MGGGGGGSASVVVFLLSGHADSSWSRRKEVAQAVRPEHGVVRNDLLTAVPSMIVIYPGGPLGGGFEEHGPCR